MGLRQPMLFEHGADVPMLVLPGLAGTLTDISVSYGMVLAGAPVIEYGPVDLRVDVDNVNIAPAMAPLDLSFHSRFLQCGIPCRPIRPSNDA
ncbi:MAG TPA: hypothetical protein VFL97_00455 [Nitrococcus sp.]|nr:hypothetical protein [Nitrococcus sp.]